MPVFGQEQNKKAAPPIFNEIVGRVNDNTKRLRLLEERERLVTSRLSSMDESFYQKIAELEEAIKDLKSGSASQDERIAVVQNTLKELTRQLKFLATRSDVKKLEEKLRIFDPLRSQIAAGDSQ